MPKKTRDERLFGASCLKVTLEKSGGREAGAADIYRATLRDLEVTEEEVDEYLSAHREEIETALKTKKRHGG